LNLFIQKQSILVTSISSSKHEDFSNVDINNLFKGFAFNINISQNFAKCDNKVPHQKIMTKKKILNLFILKWRDNNKTQNAKTKCKYSHVNLRQNSKRFWTQKKMHINNNHIKLVAI
jgi:hypothetical protein